MKKINIYRYAEDTMTILTPVPRQTTDIPHKYRLIADDGMELTDGVNARECIDVLCGDVDVWREVEKQLSAEDALNIIVGGGTNAQE